MNDRFLEIFHLYKNDIYRLSFSTTKNTSDSDDIVQNVFIKLYQHPEILEQDNQNIKKWLIRVTVNECKSLFLSSWRKKIIPITEQEVSALTQETPSNEILDAVLALPKKYRIVVFLYYYEEYKVKEIAEILNLTETNVQTRLARSRAQLKELLMEVSV